MWFDFRHAKRVRIDVSAYEYSVTNLQDALVNSENLFVMCEILDASTSLSAGATETVIYPWTTAVLGDTFVAGKEPYLKLGYLIVNGPTEKGPSGSSGREGAMVMMRNEAGSATYPICSNSGIDYLGAHFDDMRPGGVFSFPVFDSSKTLAITDAYFNSEGVNIEFHNYGASSSTLDLYGTAVAFC